MVAPSGSMSLIPIPDPQTGQQAQYGDPCLAINTRDQAYEPVQKLLSIYKQGQFERALDDKEERAIENYVTVSRNNGSVNSDALNRIDGLMKKYRASFAP
jgi:hypothetical protein